VGGRRDADRGRAVRSRRGAFTGADRQRQGRFELAHRGTLFLDEVGELSAGAQVALLRALQERRFERVGGTETVTVDVRVIAATNRDLKGLAGQQRFRDDLFYRLDVVNVELPPLRRRRGDIPALADHFIEQACARYRVAAKSLGDVALRTLLDYDFPGNVRELQNVIERAVVACRGLTIEPDDQRNRASEPVSKLTYGSRPPPAARRASLSRSVPD
jgi:transcriptional regulator with GAF, ATPase, and Fis domain